jgi:hypothetical protein
MHPNDNLLRAMIDHEISETQAETLRLHMASCPGCQARLAALQVRADRVQGRLNLLAPEMRDRQSAYQAAFTRVLSKSRQTKPRKEFFTTMSNRKSLWTALAVITILAVVFTMTPARAWASSFLGLFRVQKITVLEFDPMAAERSNETFSSQEEAFRKLLDENMTVSQGGEPFKVASAAEAATAAGFTPGVPEALQDGQYSVQPAMNAQLVIDQPKMQALLDAFEVDVQLSPEMNGQSVTVDVPAGVIITANGCQLETKESGQFGNCTALYQMPSPTVSAPEGLNVDKLGEAMLQLVGYSPLEARAVSQSIDWTSTLIVPIPSGEGIQHQDVSVNGVPGTLLTSAKEPGYMLLWVKDGVLFGLRGPGSPEEALAIGNSIP